MCVCFCMYGYDMKQWYNDKPRLDRTKNIRFFSGCVFVFYSVTGFRMTVVWVTLPFLSVWFFFGCFVFTISTRAIIFLTRDTAARLSFDRCLGFLLCLLTTRFTVRLFLFPVSLCEWVWVSICASAIFDDEDWWNNGKAKKNMTAVSVWILKIIMFFCSPSDALKVSNIC